MQYVLALADITKEFIHQVNYTGQEILISSL